ncbi:MAG TPA: hypothetical protein VN962_08965 [Polyangia bacterium]|nr:hypothetical protein [Polyangia bacterium]
MSIMMRPLRLAFAAGLVAVLGAPAARAEAGAPTPRPRVIVVDAVDLPDSLADIRANLRGTLENAVTLHNFDLGPDGGACADRECVKVAAAQNGASDVLIATGGRNEMRGYHVELRIWNVASDREDHAVAECNVCAALQMVETVKGVASTLLDRVPTLHANLAVAASQPAVPTGPVMLGRSQPAARDTSARRIAGWSLVGVGVASGVASGILFAMNGHHGDCLEGIPDSCAQERHTLLPASITAGVAVAAIVAGVIVVHGANQDLQTVTIAASPFGLTVGGRL